MNVTMPDSRRARTGLALSSLEHRVGALGLTLALLSGCGASASYHPLAGDDGARSPRDPRTVEVRATAPAPRPYREAGLVTATASKVEDVSERDFVRALRDTAASRGCDALVVSDGSRYTGSLAVLNGERPGRLGVCLVYTDGRGPDGGVAAEASAWLDGSAPREQTVTLSADAPPSACTPRGSIRTDADYPSESVKRALLRRRAREKRANYVQVSSSLEPGAELATYACPPDAAAKAAPLAKAP